MKPKDIFGLAVRILGLILFYHLLMVIPAMIGIFGANSFFQIGMGLLAFTVALTVIWWLIGGAPQLMKHAYPED